MPVLEHHSRVMEFVMPVTEHHRHEMEFFMPVMEHHGHVMEFLMPVMEHHVAVMEHLMPVMEHNSAQRLPGRGVGRAFRAGCARECQDLFGGCGTELWNLGDFFRFLTLNRSVTPKSIVRNVELCLAPASQPGAAGGAAACAEVPRVCVSSRAAHRATGAEEVGCYGSRSHKQSRTHRVLRGAHRPVDGRRW